MVIQSIFSIKRKEHLLSAYYIPSIVQRPFYKDINKVIQLFSQMAKTQRGILIRMINFIKSDKISLGPTKYQPYHLELLIFRKL